MTIETLTNYANGLLTKATAMPYNAKDFALMLAGACEMATIANANNIEMVYEIGTLLCEYEAKFASLTK